MKFIFCADLHLRADRPRCRIDNNWIETQRRQLEMIASTAVKYKLPVVICGDIFHTAQVPDYIKTMFLKEFYDTRIYILAGNHDLPHHSWTRVNYSSFGILWQMRGQNNVHDLEYFGSYSHYGQPVVESGKDCLFIHELVFNSVKSIPPNVQAFTISEIFKAYPEYKWIFSGDNHRGFWSQYKGKNFIMAGSMNRQAIDMKDYEPRIWIVDTDKGSIDSEVIPDDVNMLVEDEYIKESDNRKERLAAFIEQIKSSKNISLDYIQNIEDALKTNDLSDLTKDIVHELIRGNL